MADIKVGGGVSASGGSGGKTATIITTSTVLTAADDGKIIVASGVNIDITLPASGDVSVGWQVTLVNENATNVFTAHTSSPANLPIGQSTIRVLRAGSDTIDGAATEFHGAGLLLPSRECIDVWKVSGTGFQGAPSHTVGWKDNPSSPAAFGGNANDPSESNVDASFMRMLEFTNANSGSEKEVYYNVHINHDYVMGTRAYLHVHFYAGNTVATTTAGMGFQYSCNKGHGQGAIDIAGTTVYTAQVLNGTPYTHYVSEVSDADAVPADNIEPDTNINVRMFRDSANAGGSGDDTTSSIWVSFVDCHYLSTEGGTPNKAPPFYL